jgi:hypothetical protein
MAQAGAKPAYGAPSDRGTIFPRAHARNTNSLGRLKEPGGGDGAAPNLSTCRNPATGKKDKKNVQYHR